MYQKIVIGCPPETIDHSITPDEARSAVFLAAVGAAIYGMDTGKWAGLSLPVLMLFLFVVFSDDIPTQKKR